MKSQNSLLYLKNYDSQFTMQELKINVIPNGFEKYISFGINSKFSFYDIFQFLRSSLDSLL